MRTSEWRTRLITMFVEQRVEPREFLALPLKLGDGCSAVTRNISASGMYLVIAGFHELKGPVVFEMHLADVRMKFTAEGEILRIEHRPGYTGVAIRLRAPRLDPIA